MIPVDSCLIHTQGYCCSPLSSLCLKWNFSAVFRSTTRLAEIVPRPSTSSRIQYEQHFREDHRAQYCPSSKAYDVPATSLIPFQTKADLRASFIELPL